MKEKELDFSNLFNDNKEESLENKEDSFVMDSEMDFSTIFHSNPEAKEIEGLSSSDGLILSLTNLGYVDIEYISKITNKTYEDIITDLKGSIFQNPLSWDETYIKDGRLMKSIYLVIYDLNIN